MIRLVGAALVCAGAAGLGFGAAAGLGRRVRTVSEVRAGVRAMARGLESGLPPLEELLRNGAGAAQGQAGAFFAACADKIRRWDGTAFSALWETALEGAALPIEPEEEAVLRRLGSVLGRYDAAGQRLALEQAAAELGEILDKARERQERLGRVYRAVGVCAGLFAAILLW